MNELYESWLEMKQQLSFYKKRELEIRNEILNKLDTGKIEGIEKFDNKQYLVKASRGLTISLSEAELDTFYKELSDQEKACIKYKPSLVAKEFKKLSGKEKLFDAIIVKPAQATLEISHNERN